MTQDEIIEMARQSGDVLTDSRGRMDFCFDSYGLEAFAKLVAKKAYLDGLENGIKAEREACAKICDSFQERDVGMQPAECAGAIRARGQA